MKKYGFNLIVILLLSFNFAIAQYINPSIKKYQIITGTDQLGELILEESNGRYKGLISYTFYQGKVASSKSFVGRLLHQSGSATKKKTIIVKIELADSVSRALMLKLENAGIERLLPCNEDPECAKLNFLDGDFTVFNLTINGQSKELEYAAVGYPISKYPEKIDLRKKVQNLVQICIEDVNYMKHFKDARSKLTRGWYYMYSGNGYLTFRIR